MPNRPSPASRCVTFVKMLRHDLVCQNLIDAVDAPLPRREWPETKAEDGYLACRCVKFQVTRVLACGQYRDARQLFRDATHCVKLIQSDRKRCSSCHAALRATSNTRVDPKSPIPPPALPQRYRSSHPLRPTTPDSQILIGPSHR
jgi:hypothetical protein